MGINQKYDIGPYKMISEEFILETPIFTTRDYAHSLDLRLDSASRKLSSLLDSGLLTRAGKGLWYNERHEKFSSLSLVPYILRGEQGYVSFLSALSYHGVISQIPQKTFVATTGHARVVNVGAYQFDIIQIKPEFIMHGLLWKDTYALASAEKALIDCFYVSSRRGKRFLHLPELDLSGIDAGSVRRIIEQHGFSKSVEVFVLGRLEEVPSYSLRQGPALTY